MKTAVIIGATGGIGSVIAQGLAKGGWNLLLTGSTAEKLESMFGALKSDAEVQLCPLDLKDPDKKALDELCSKVSSVDLLVNAAGIFNPGNREVSEDQVRELMEVNVIGPFRVLKAFVPGMIEQGAGTVISIGSRRSKIATPDEGAYSMSKFAVAGMGEALYRELSPQGIKYTTICPGWVNTSMSDASSLKPEEMIQAQDILEAILFIEKLSPSAVVKEILIEPGKDVSA